MSNLVQRLSQQACLTRQEVIDSLSELLEGRSIGPTYIVGVQREGSNRLIIETGDGCRFLLLCEEP